MPVLKDIQCQVCKAITEEMVDGDVTTVYQPCETCGKERVHNTRCTGGVKEIMWSMEGKNLLDYVDGCTQVMVGKPRQEDIGTPNEAKNARPVTMKDGTPVHELPRFQDGLKERREKRRWKFDRRRYGKRMIFT